MDYTLAFHQQLSETIAEITGLRIGYTDEKVRQINLNGLTRHNFILSVLYAVKDEQWKLRIWSNATKQNKDELIAGLLGELPNFGASDGFEILRGAFSLKFQLAIRILCWSKRRC